MNLNSPKFEKVMWAPIRIKARTRISSIGFVKSGPLSEPKQGLESPLSPLINLKSAAPSSDVLIKYLVHSFLIRMLSHKFCNNHCSKLINFRLFGMAAICSTIGCRGGSLFWENPTDSRPMAFHVFFFVFAAWGCLVPPFLMKVSSIKEIKKGYLTIGNHSLENPTVSLNHHLYLGCPSTISIDTFCPFLYSIYCLNFWRYLDMENRDINP